MKSTQSKIRLVLTALISFIVFGKTLSQKDSIYMNLTTDKKTFDNIYQLDLSYLDDFNGVMPEQVKNYKNIVSIDFGDLYLTTVPRWIESLKSLKTLSFNDSYLECESRDLLVELNIENPMAGEPGRCVEKIVGIYQGHFAPSLVAYKNNNELLVENTVTKEIVFNNITDFKITPCGRIVIVKKDSLYMPVSNADDYIDAQQFVRHGFSSDIAGMELFHCESGKPGLLTLANGDAFYFDPWRELITKKGKKRTGYEANQTECEKVISTITYDVNSLKYLLENFYHYTDCTKEMLAKARAQAEKINTYGKYLEWSFEKQDVVFRKVTIFPVENTEEKTSECMEFLKNWQENNPDQKSLPTEVMLELEKLGCITISINQ